MNIAPSTYAYDSCSACYFSIIAQKALPSDSLCTPSRFKMWAIMSFHCFLSFVLFNSLPLSNSLFILLVRVSPVHLLKLTKYFNCRLPQLVFPSTRPVNLTFSRPSFLIMYPKNVNYHFLIVCCSFLSVLIFVRSYSYSCHSILKFFVDLTFVTL